MPWLHMSMELLTASSCACIARFCAGWKPHATSGLMATRPLSAAADMGPGFVRLRRRGDDGAERVGGLSAGSTTAARPVTTGGLGCSMTTSKLATFVLGGADNLEVMITGRPWCIGGRRIGCTESADGAAAEPPCARIRPWWVGVLV